MSGDEKKGPANPILSTMMMGVAREMLKEFSKSRVGGPEFWENKTVQDLQHSCNHAWQVIGFERETPMVINVYVYCAKCLAHTYRPTNFVGYRLEDIGDVLYEESDIKEL